MGSIARVTEHRGRLLLIALCVSVGLAAFAVQALGSFSKPRHFAVGVGPTSVAIGDLNGDGKRDLAVAGGKLSVLLGNGAGGFSKARNFAVPAGSSAVAIGDFNGDDIPDLVTAGGNNSVSVLLGNGNGSFGAAMSYAVGRYPRSVAIGDLNRDGRPDLAVGNSGSSQRSVSVLLGNGNGSFWPAGDVALDTAPTSVAIGDFNGDGIPDLAAARRTTVVSVLLGNGNGSFEAPMQFGVGPYPSSVGIRDLNGDGNLDLAVAINGSHNQQLGSVAILLGNGEGNFGAVKHFAAGFHPRSVAIGDFNRDGKPDLAVSDGTPGSGLGQVSILIGKGGGSFAAPRHLRVGSGRSEPMGVAIGKLNAGPYPDLAVALSGTKNVSVLLNRGPGTPP